MALRHVFTQCALVAAAGAASAQPTIDGRLAGDEALYGPPKWVQTNPTGMVDNSPSFCLTAVGGGVTIAIDNSNTAGVGGGSPAAATDGAGTAVTTGVELRIPLSQLGNPTGPIKVAAWINGGGSNYLSNQVTGGYPAPQGNLGGDGTGGFNGGTAGINFNNFAGDQFITVSNAPCSTGTPPAIDGTRDAAYGPALFEQTVETGFGNSTLGVVDFANGSELDAGYGFVCEANLGQGPQKYLFLFLAGNLESNDNRLSIFIDSGAGGQNVLRGDNPNVDGLNTMQGLTFDAGFEADYYIAFHGGSNPYTTGAVFSEVRTAGGGSGSGIGSGGAGAAGVLNGNPCGPTTTPGLANYSVGSELDAVYSRIDTAAGKLYFLITGNVSTTAGDRLMLFLDAIAGAGQNTVRNDNVVLGLAEGGDLNRVGNNGIDPGLTFDAGFASDYSLVFHYEATPARHVLDATTMRTTGKLQENGFSLDYGSYNGVNAPGVIPFNGTNFDTFAGPGGMTYQDGTILNLYSYYAPRESGRVRAAAAALNVTQPDWPAFVAANAVPGLIRANSDQSNTGGVTATSAAGAAGATTGVEVEVDLDELGWDGTSDIRLAGFLTNSGITQVGNQVLGSVPNGAGGAPPAALGEPRQINFGAVAGNQYVTLATGGPACRADFNNSGAVDVADIFAFLSAWFAQGPGSDFNNSGATDVADIFAFLSAWFAGCP